MPPLFNALVSLALMLAVVALYVAAARRVRVLWHPLSIVAAVALVGFVVSVGAEALFRGPAGVPAMARRSAVGGIGWGVVIAIVVWVGRRVRAKRA